MPVFKDLVLSLQGFFNELNTVPFWIRMKGRFIHIQYFALRDEDGTYTLEGSQGQTDGMKLEGEKILEIFTPFFPALLIDPLKSLNFDHWVDKRNRQGRIKPIRPGNNRS